MWSWVRGNVSLYVFMVLALGVPGYWADIERLAAMGTSVHGDIWLYHA